LVLVGGKANQSQNNQNAPNYTFFNQDGVTPIQPEAGFRLWHDAVILFVYHITRVTNFRSELVSQVQR
jgi:hypothetical protein